MAISKTYKKIYISIPAVSLPIYPWDFIEYYVKKGDVVKQGDKIFVLQAMKMG